MQFTTQNKRRALTTGEVQNKPMSKGYTVVDPAPIAQELVGAGWHVRHFDKLMEGGRWSQALEVQAPTRLSSWPAGYRPQFKALFNHQGRRALLIYPGGMRIHCENDFYGEPVWRARHDDRQKVARLLQNPVGLFSSLLPSTTGVVHRIEHLRAVPTSCAWFTTMPIIRPRIWNKVLAELTGTYAADSGNMWGLMQAFTEVKLPGAQKIADRCLGEDFETTRRNPDATGETNVPSFLLRELEKRSILN